MSDTQECQMRRFLLHKCDHKAAEILFNLGDSLSDGENPGNPDELRSKMALLMRYAESKGCNTSRVLSNMLKQDKLAWVVDRLEIDNNMRLAKCFGIARRGQKALKAGTHTQTDDIVMTGPSDTVSAPQQK